MQRLRDDAYSNKKNKGIKTNMRQYTQIKVGTKLYARESELLLSKF